MPFRTTERAAQQHEMAATARMTVASGKSPRAHAANQLLNQMASRAQLRFEAAQEATGPICYGDLYCLVPRRQPFGIGATYEIPFRVPARVKQELKRQTTVGAAQDSLRRCSDKVSFAEQCARITGNAVAEQPQANARR